jgi:hypothetical protein
MTLHANDSRVPEAQKIITSLRREQAYGCFRIAQFYDKSKTLPLSRRSKAAEIYYNEVVNLSLGDPKWVYAVQARERLEELKKRNPAAKP